MGRHHPMHARRQSQAHKRIAANVSTPPRPRASSDADSLDATSAKPQSSCSTPPAARPARSPTSRRPCPTSPPRSTRPASSSARPPAAMNAICWPLSSPPASPAHRADARKVKAFIRSFGTLGKSDAIDATALARYGLDRHAELPLWSAREPERERLQALVLARRDLVKDRLAYANRRAAPHRRARPPLSRGARRKLRCANQGDRSRHQDLVRRVRADRQGRPNPGHDPGRRSENRRRPHRPHARTRFAPPTPGRRPRRPCAPSQSKRPDRPPIAEPVAEDPKSNASSSWPQSPPQNTTRPSAPSTNAPSAQAKNPSSPSPQSCENSSSSLTPNSEQPMLFK